MIENVSMKAFAGFCIAIFVLIQCAAAQGSSADALFPVSQNGKFGYINLSGQVVIAPVYESAEPFSNGLARVSLNSRFGYINSRGEWVIPAMYGQGSMAFSGGLVALEKTKGKKKEKSRYGFADAKGEWVIKPKFEALRAFSNGRAAANMAAKWGFINKKGEWIIPAMYEETGDFSGGYATFLLDGKYGYLDTTGKIVIPPRFRAAGPFSEELASADEGDGFGFINIRGEWVIEPQFWNPKTEPPVFKEGFALVRNQRDLWGVVDKSGNWLVEAMFQKAYPFSEGLFGATMGGMWGYVNQDGKVAIAFEAKYDDVGPFRNGLAKVSINGSWNFYTDRYGKIVWNGENVKQH